MESFREHDLQDGHETRRRRGASSRGEERSSASQNPAAIQAAGNMAVQRRATDNASVSSFTPVEGPMSVEEELVSRPVEDRSADEQVSRPETIGIHFDPK